MHGLSASLGIVLAAFSALPVFPVEGLPAQAQGALDLRAEWQAPPSSIPVTRLKGHEVAAGEVLVKFRSFRLEVFDEIVRENDIGAYKVIGRGDVVRMRSASRDVASMLEQLRARPDVEYAEPNFLIRAEQSPNDPSYSLLWGLENTGQITPDTVAGTPDADIDADLAWNWTTGSDTIVVGVVDSGIDYAHVDLAANVWSAPGAFSVTVGGVVVNCAAGTHGYNAINGNCDPQDEGDHGTHVAGIIGAEGNNATQTVGVNWTTSMMGLKFLDASGSGTLADAIDAIEFAIQTKTFFSATNGADVRVLNASWGSSFPSEALSDQILAAYNAGILFVAGAGNGGENNDFFPHYPGGFQIPALIAVAATTNTDDLAGFSSYGAASVDLGAPGAWIFSTSEELAGGRYASGTSMAVPHVTGAAALILSACDLATFEVSDLILATVDPVDSLREKTTTGGRLNVGNALDLCGPGNPTYTMSVAPGGTQVTPGSTAEYVIDIRSWFGFTGDVTLQATGTLQGTFSPSTVGGGSGASLLSVPTGPGDAGTYVLTVTGSSGGIVRSRDVMLRVVAEPPPSPIGCSGTIQGSLSDQDPMSTLRAGSFRDRYVFEVETEGLATISLSSTQIDSYLYLLDSGSGVIASNDDIELGIVLDSRIEESLSPGTYLIEATSWAPAETGSYALTLDCPDRSDVVIDFGAPYGIWIRENDTGWSQLHPLSPRSMVTGDLDGNGLDEVVIDFGAPYGIWVHDNDTGWSQLHPLSPQAMVTGDPDGDGSDEVVIDFGAPYGIWVHDNDTGWSQLHPLSPRSMVTGDLDGNGLDEIIIGFGAPYGLWIRRNNANWIQIHSISPESMATGDLDGNGLAEVVVDFGAPHGLWVRNNNTSWLRIHSFSPESMVTGDLDGDGSDEVVVDYGDPYGVWGHEAYTDLIQLHPVSPESMVTGDLDGDGSDEIVADFGEQYGIWVRGDDGAWSQLHPLSPESMVVGSLGGS